MKYTLKTALTGLLAASALAWVSVGQAASLQEIVDRGAIRIAIANEIPYGYMDLSGEAKGVGPDVARHVIARLGIKDIQWTTTGFGSLIPGLRANRFDMVAAEMAILPQRCRQIMFSQPNSSYGEGLLVPRGNPQDIHSFEYFADNGEKVAIMAGADQLEMLQALGVPHGQMVTIANNADAISTVATGRAAAYAATSATVRQLAGKSDKVESAAKFTDPVIDGQPVRSWGAFTFTEGSDELVAAFDQELAAFKKTPEWRKIMDRYGFTEADATESFDRTREMLCQE